MPGLSVAELMAPAMPLSVSLLLLMVTLKLEPPSDSVRAPVPTAAPAPPVNALDSSCCADARVETVTL